MTVTVNLIGARGGQGTSTTAAALGLLATRRGHRTELITDTPDTMCALLGLPAAAGVADAVEIVPGFTLHSEPSGSAGLVITDTGTAASAHDAVELVQLAVLRGPCYLSLRATVDLARRGVDGVVIVREPGRSLTKQDVATVTGVGVGAETQASPAVARAIDAGVFPASIGRLAEFAALDRWLDTLPVAVATSPATASTAPLTVRQSPVRFDRSRSDTDLPLPLSGSSRGRDEVAMGVVGSDARGVQAGAPSTDQRVVQLARSSPIPVALARGTGVERWPLRSVCHLRLAQVASLCRS